MSIPMHPNDSGLCGTREHSPTANRNNSLGASRWLRCILPLLLLLSRQTTSQALDVNFISTSDSHYREPDNRLGHHNDLNRASIEEMNRITTLSWPEKLGGGTIGKPRGVVVLGDLIDDGDRGTKERKISEEQYKLFAADFGLDGTDGHLKFPAFEGWGNHDGPPEGKEKFGFSSQAQIRKRNQLRKQKGLISNLSDNGLHYSWDWDGVHFVQLNLYPADQQDAGVHYSQIWHNPQDALAFLKKDLAEKVVTSGRPINATYEGDLMAQAGVKYTVGREGSAQYGESLAGFFPAPLRPRTVEYMALSGTAYSHGTPCEIQARDASGKLYWGISDKPWPAPGTGDRLVQSYNFRVIATRNKENQVPFPKPKNYYPERYELLLQMVLKYPGIRFPRIVYIGGGIPNGKSDLNASGLVIGHLPSN